MSAWLRFTAGMVLVALCFSLSAVAQDHVVGSVDLQKEAVAAGAARQQQVQAVERFLSSPRADKALRDAHMDPTQVKKAVSSLSDDDLARLSARADRAQADFAAGRLGERDLILIVLGVAVLVLIIVAVR